MTDAQFDEIIELIKQQHDAVIEANPWLGAQTVDELERARDARIRAIEEGRKRAGRWGDRPRG
ncbi:MAG TPA: hypothetical protein VFH30_19830 [Acidimicrobiales bacterium]|jgi:hypothetical protein|nr:hypothetical protein [Acidimicrobiales bacterium]